MIALLSMVAAAAPECSLDVPADTEFQVPLAADGVRVMLELWFEGADAAWAESTLVAVADAGIPATVMMPAGPLPDAYVGPLSRVKEVDTLNVGFVLPESVVPQNLDVSLRPIRRSLRPVRKVAGRTRTVVAPIGNRASEAMLGRAGFRELIDATAPAGAGSRYAGILEGMQRINVVFPGGPYQGPCGPDPRVGPFTPAAADRAARAIQQAAAVPGAPVVRVALIGKDGAPTDGEVLVRWVTEILGPGGVTVVTPRQARLAALSALQKGIDMSQAVASVGRVVSLKDAVAAAEALRTVTTVPRGLPGDLTPSEAFYAWTLVVAGRDDGSAVRIRSLSGPSNDARTSLKGVVPVSADDLRATAKALLAAMPAEVPAAIPVGDQLLTASELLMALASLVRGDDPVETRPVAVPDPNARGLGWGSATP